DGKKRCKSCGRGTFGKMQADKFKKKVEAELLTGTYRSQRKKTWADFRAEYEEKILGGLAPKTRSEAIVSLDHFERIVKPGRMLSICTKSVDQFIAARREESGKKPGSLLSPASTNKDLRHIKAALRVAKEWDYLENVPKFRMEKVPKKLPTYVTGDHF